MSSQQRAGGRAVARDHGKHGTGRLLQDRFRKLSSEDHDRLVERVAEILNRWKPVLGLQGWTIDLMPRVYTDEEDNCKAQIETWPEYRHADIDLNVRRLDHVDDLELEETIVHELGHAFVSRFIADWKHTNKRYRRDLEEGLVSDITGALQRAWHQGV